MNMQDNELDDLFRAKLGQLEMEPAAQVWQNIQAGLGGQKKKSWVPILSIAATVLVLLTAGTWFLLDKPVKNNQKQVVRIKAAPQDTEAVESTQPSVIETQPVENIASQTPVKSIAPVTRIAHIKQSKAGRVMGSIKLQEVKATAVNEPLAQPQTPVLASVQNKPVMHPVVPEMNLNAPLNDAEPTIVKSVNATAANAAATSEPEKKGKRRGIHSLGGLINAVIAKVDKREDKLIEFTETDEDQSNVTGINLGLLKIKKDK
jgi:hypothetical protein